MKLIRIGIYFADGFFYSFSVWGKVPLVDLPQTCPLMNCMIDPSGVIDE
jgi:hypothetical protein